MNMSFFMPTQQAKNFFFLLGTSLFSRDLHASTSTTAASPSSLARPETSKPSIFDRKEPIHLKMKLAIAALLAGSAAAFTSSPAPKSSVALHETKVRKQDE